MADLRQNAPHKLGYISLMLNMDMIGSPNYFYGVYAGSTAPQPIRNISALIETEIGNALEKYGAKHQPTAFDGRSDYGPFIEVYLIAYNCRCIVLT